MSPRYYLISGIIIVVITMTISWWKEAKSIKEVFVVFCRVVALLLILIFALVGLVELFVYLGIAQDGFITQRDEFIIQREENRWRLGWNFHQLWFWLCFFFGVSFFMGMLIHSSFMYEDKQNLKQDSKKAWILSMTAGVGITGWMFVYGYYSNFL